jgi:SAM-dependent methyltransferase
VVNAPAQFWDVHFRRLREQGRDLDWGEQWVPAFLGPLQSVGARKVVELGCGTGNDAARLAHAGFAVTALDYSTEAIAQASAKFGRSVSLVVADLAAPLPFLDGSADAVMSNVALHMFGDSVTRALFREIRRVVRPDGLALLHVNAIEDRSLRARWSPVVEELEPDFVREASGQTMHFFSREYLSDLLAEWRDVDMHFVEIAAEKGAPFSKRVWRAIARR